MTKRTAPGRRPDPKKVAKRNGPPIEESQGNSSCWKCCEKLLQTEYCPDCGGERPNQRFSTRVDKILQDFKIEQLRAEIEAAKSWSRMVKIKIGQSAIVAATSRAELDEIMRSLRLCPSVGNSKGLGEWKAEAIDQARMEFSQEEGLRDTHLRKARSLADLILNVTQLDRTIVGLLVKIESPMKFLRASAPIPSKRLGELQANHAIQHQNL